MRSGAREEGEGRRQGGEGHWGPGAREEGEGALGFGCGGRRREGEGALGFGCGGREEEGRGPARLNFSVRTYIFLCVF